MTTSFTTLSTVAIPTRDQERSKAFYRDTLGFDERADVDMSAGFRWIEVAPPGAAMTIALLPAGDTMPAGRDTGIRLVADDAAATHAAMSDADVDELLDWPDAPLMYMFRDLDENTIYVVEAE